jgi:uncharacterized membrane protein YjgN (DUF898 family)
MKSKLKRMKGILGLNTVKAFIVVLLSLAIIAVVTLIVLGAILNANISPSGSAAANGTETIISNVSTGITNFFGNSLTYFALLGVVVIILIISLVVVVVNRFGGSTGREEL